MVRKWGLARHKRTNKCKSHKQIESETTQSESTVDTDSIYESLIMVFDVEHTGCKEQLILQLSWGIYKQDGTLLEIKDYYLEPTDFIYINPRASNAHHITWGTLLQKPNKLNIGQMLNEFMSDLKKNVQHLFLIM